MIPGATLTLSILATCIPRTSPQGYFLLLDRLVCLIARLRSSVSNTELPSSLRPVQPCGNTRLHCTARPPPESWHDDAERLDNLRNIPVTEHKRKQPHASPYKPSVGRALSDCQFEPAPAARNRTQRLDAQKTTKILLPLLRIHLTLAEKWCHEWG
ncbi:hypothetical protein F4823DRAFT_10054 [Ustulina deusta]|nr:hypothetical protein F4823DRAFT_10054 [Ustulina deusta]